MFRVELRPNLVKFTLLEEGELVRAKAGKRAGRLVGVKE